MVDRLEAMPIHALMVRVEPLEDKVTTVGGFECGDNFMGSVARMEEHIEAQDNAQ